MIAPADVGISEWSERYVFGEGDGVMIGSDERMDLLGEGLEMIVSPPLLGNELWARRLSFQSIAQFTLEQTTSI